MSNRSRLVGLLCSFVLAGCATGRATGTSPDARPDKAQQSEPTASATSPSDANDRRSAFELGPPPKVGASFAADGGATRGELARQAGPCETDAVKRAGGSIELAARACEQQRKAEEELATGLRLTIAVESVHGGREHHRQGQLQQASNDYAKAIYRDEIGGKHSDVTDIARSNRALLHHEEGAHEQAHQELASLLSDATAPTVRAAASHNLALVLLETGEPSQALEAARKARALLDATPEAPDAARATVLNTLGVIEGERGELEEAEALLRAAIELRTSALGPQHPDTAASYTNLGIVLGERGDWPSALAIHRKALAIDAAVLGPAHAVTAVDHANIGRASFELGRHAQACTAFETAHENLAAQRAHEDPELARLRAWIRICEKSG